MIDVKLIAHTNADSLKLASLAAMECYQSTPPSLDNIKEFDIKRKVFDVGHGTVNEHYNLNFQIEGVAVGNVTLGLHLTSPFYNTDQRSGRFCAKMFLHPNFEEIEKYIKFFWANISSEVIDRIIDYVKYGLEVYFSNIEGATGLAKKFIKEERPFASEKYIEANGPKFAQEQMRMFIPVIFPTGLVYTINLISLAALYQSSWDPVVGYITDRMKDELLAKFPRLEFMFIDERRRTTEWKKLFDPRYKIKKEVACEPILWGFEADIDGLFVIPESGLMHPIDCLHYNPDLMDNNFGGIRTEVEISLATMGQDQRHRTISRGMPHFTGRFYTPPLLDKLDLHRAALHIMRDWLELTEKVPPSLARVIAPYGAMVRYCKRGSFNAVAHESFKRLCWCAQEEIYHLARLSRRQLKWDSKLLAMYEPVCYKTGVCGEGDRYCGRDIEIRKTGDYFPKRKI